MVNILNDAIYDIFMNLVENTEKEIKICAPFIKTSIVDDILTYKKQNVNITTITNVKLMSFYRKVLDIEALSKILISNGNVYNFPMLHAKIYIFDDNNLIITSANLTEAGLKKNKEYGIISDESILIHTANTDFNNMCKDDITGKLRLSNLNDIQGLLDTVPQEKRIKLPNYELENDEVYPYDIISSSPNLLGWKKDIFDIIVQFPDNHFTLHDFEIYISHLKILHPQNNNIQAKIRQVLQQLRDLGLIKFEGNGSYLRFFK
jgi:HKD family nuclease